MEYGRATRSPAMSIPARMNWPALKGASSASKRSDISTSLQRMRSTTVASTHSLILCSSKAIRDLYGGHGPAFNPPPGRVCVPRAGVALIRSTDHDELQRIHIRITAAQRRAPRLAGRVFHARRIEPAFQRSHVLHAKRDVTIAAAVLRTHIADIGIGQLHQVQLLAAAKLVPLAGIRQLGAAGKHLASDDWLIKGLRPRQVGHQ